MNINSTIELLYINMNIKFELFHLIIKNEK